MWLHESVVLRVTPVWRTLVRDVRDAAPGLVTKRVLSNLIRDAVGKRGLVRWLKALAASTIKAAGRASASAGAAQKQPELGKKL